eukprot:6349229-Alexandrium_andersonii.AAC.1
MFARRRQRLCNTFKPARLRPNGKAVLVKRTQVLTCMLVKRTQVLTCMLAACETDTGVDLHAKAHVHETA